MFGRIEDIVRELGRRVAAWRGRHLVSFVDEDPERVEAGTINVIGEGGHSWYAAMACPCGCKETTKLAMVEGSPPQWSFVRHWGDRVSLKPSVWRKDGCQSHFWVRDGRIDWC